MSTARSLATMTPQVGAAVRGVTTIASEAGPSLATSKERRGPPLRRRSSPPRRGSTTSRSSPRNLTTRCFPRETRTRL